MSKKDWKVNELKNYKSIFVRKKNHKKIEEDYFLLITVINFIKQFSQEGDLGFYTIFCKSEKNTHKLFI